MFLRFPKDKNQCGATSGLVTMTGSWGRSSKASESVKALNSYSVTGGA